MRNYKEWQGTDADIEASLVDYGVIIREAINPKDGEFEYQMICRYAPDQYIVDGVDARYIEEKIKDIKDWSSCESFLSFHDLSSIDEFLELSLIQQIADLLSYFGYEEIMGGGGNFGLDLVSLADVRYLFDEEAIPSWAQILLVDSHHGVFSYEIFWKQYKHLLTPESAEKLSKIEDSELNPDYEFYCDVWLNVEQNAELNLDHGKYTIYQNEDLWAIHEDYEIGEDEVIRKKPAPELDTNLSDKRNSDYEQIKDQVPFDDFS